MAIVQARPPDALYVDSVQARFGGLDLHAEAISFRTYWTGKPRELARLRDWRTAWLNWLKKVVAGPNYRKPVKVQPGRGVSQDRLAALSAARDRKELAQLAWIERRKRDGRANEDDLRMAARITRERANRSSAQEVSK